MALRVIDGDEASRQCDTINLVYSSLLKEIKTVAANGEVRVREVMTLMAKEGFTIEEIQAAAAGSKQAGNAPRQARFTKFMKEIIDQKSLNAQFEAGQVTQRQVWARLRQENACAAESYDTAKVKPRYREAAATILLYEEFVPMFLRARSEIGVEPEVRTFPAPIVVGLPTFTTLFPGQARANNRTMICIARNGAKPVVLTIGAKGDIRVGGATTAAVPGPKITGVDPSCEGPISTEWARLRAGPPGK